MEAELTDREWFLVKRTFETTLEVMLKVCDESGMPGRIIANALLADFKRDHDHVDLRLATEATVKEYRTDAK